MEKIMFKATMHVLTIACCLTAAVLMSAQPSLGQCGCASTAPVYSTSYAPAYVAPYTVGYAPVATAYMPGVVYRSLYAPRPQVAYRPVIGYNTYYTGYGVTTYRPAWNYPARLVPYTTYQPVYSAAMPVVSYMGCSTCPSYSACDTCSPCSSGSCGATTYAAPACSSCAAPATTVTPTPYTSNGDTAPSLNSVPSNGALQKTFEEKTQKPVAEPEVKPIPQTDGKPSSMPMPSLPDPANRTAARSDYAPSRVQLTSATVEASPVLSNDGWLPARD
jgi:hypothetical protein